MSQLLAVDRLPYRLLAGWVALVRAGLVWMLWCVPLVTAPAATLVLMRTVDRILAGSTPPGWGECWRIVRDSFGASLRLAALMALGWGVVVTATFGPSPGGAWDTVLPVVIVPVAVTWLLASQWAFPLLDQRGDGAVAALRCSYVRAISRPDQAALSAIGTTALVVVGLLVPSAVWLPYWLTVPALWAALVTLTAKRAAPAVSSTAGVVSSQRRETP